MVHNDIDSYHGADRERVSKIVQFLANTASSTTSNITNLLILWSIFVGERFSMCQHSEQLCTHTLTAHTGRAHNSLYSVSMSAIIHDSAFHWNGALFHSIQTSAGRIHSQLTYITFAIAHLFCVCFPLRFFFLSSLVPSCCSLEHGRGQSSQRHCTQTQAPCSCLYFSKTCLRFTHDLRN